MYLKQWYLSLYSVAVVKHFLHKKLSKQDLHILLSQLKIGAILHKVQGFLTVAVGGGGVAVGGGACGGGGVAGSDAVSAPKETSPSPSSCGMAPNRSVPTPLCPLAGSTGCGRFRFRLAGGAGGDGLATAPELPALAVATASFLAAARVRRVAALAAAIGAAVVGSDAVKASQ
jgi:hypothetical protein